MADARTEEQHPDLLDKNEYTGDGCVEPKYQTHPRGGGDQFRERERAGQSQFRKTAVNEGPPRNQPKEQ
jgi:hypothetical protein